MAEFDQSYIKSVSFSTYTESEKTKLCVKVVTTWQTCDDVGVPVPSGLSDTAMGSSDPGEVCLTCSLNGFECPGHFGLIKFALPVYNPVFFGALVSLLRGSCFICHHTYAKQSVLHRFTLQLDLLNCGLFNESRQLEENVNRWSAHLAAKNLLPSQQEEALISKIKRYRTRYLKENSVIGSVAETRTFCDERQNMSKRFMKESYTDASCTRCHFCSMPAVRIKSEFSANIGIKFLVTKKEKIDNLDPIIAKHSTIKLDVVSLNKIQFLTAADVLLHFKFFYQNHSEFLNTLFCRSPDSSLLEMFFLESLCVIPPKFRPQFTVGDRKFESPTTGAFRKIMVNQSSVERALLEARGETNASVQSLPPKSLGKKIYSKSFSKNQNVYEKLQASWSSLQVSVNILFDSTLTRAHKEDCVGLRQLLEKKEGLFRMHMMGKRVNQAARSVIAPDPMLDINEVGLPSIFATKLSFSEPFTQHNTQQLLSCVKNGPATHPGATHVHFGPFKSLLHASNRQRNEAMCNKILSELSSSKDISVRRHLQNDDVVLMNRQPTLHRPSIMGHRVRVLPKGRTIRLHYANCKSYNADFDGDEMNAHFPQSHLGRSEAINITSSCYNYLSPRDGKPLTGLIQDYMVSGVLLTVRDRFFTVEKFNKLLYSALVNPKQLIVCLPPTILKPTKLWTGKQLISTLIINSTPRGSVFLNMHGKSKVTEKLWPGSTPVTDPNMSEDNILVRNGQLLRGIFDKNQLGSSPYGLIHVFHELYGGEYANKFLSVLGRACISLLQYSGFSMGVHDVVCTSSAMKARHKLLLKSRNSGERLLKAVFESKPDTSLKEQFRKAHLAQEERKMMELDNQAKNIANNYQNLINQTCSGGCLVKPFPSNSLQLMIQSGSKGTPVNAMQISGLIGQVELEGLRPPLMISGRTLPCFEPYSSSLQSGGFIESNFLLGLKPFEYFFHCMAGREGLVDTAVKTSRSGYLQRCLIKHLEGVTVRYDYSVRDSDGSVIQFLYGDDGCDICSLQFAHDNKFEIFSMNRKQLENSLKPQAAFKHIDNTSALDHLLNSQSKKKNRTTFPPKSNLSCVKIKDTRISSVLNVPLPPTLALFNPGHYYGAISELFYRSLINFTETDAGNTIVSGKYSSLKWQCNKKNFINLMLLKYMRCLCVPGEAVGVLTGQSIGEPSTQMTLNTFHFAGRGEMNVTLGIPRLRELFLAAGDNIKTPSISVLIKSCDSALKVANSLVLRMNPIPLSKLISSMDLLLKYDQQPDSRLVKYKCSISMKFASKSNLKSYGMSAKTLSRFIEHTFTKQLSAEVTKKSHIKSQKLIAIKETFTSSKRTKEFEKNDADEKEEEAQQSSYSSSSSDSETCSLDNEPVAVDQQLPFMDEPYDGPQDNQKYLEQVSQTLATSTHGFVFDKKQSCCSFDLTVDVSSQRVSLIPLIRKIVDKTILNEKVNIKRCFISTDAQRSLFQIEGNNIFGLWQYADIFELETLYSNNVQKMFECFGIEAARTTLIKEVRSVFEAYGITVNYRHLSLLGDYMTFHGTYRPCNRYGIAANPSSFQKMSFETTVQFLKNACTFGEVESLLSPSARLVTGLPVKIGTAAFEVLSR